MERTGLFKLLFVLASTLFFLFLWTEFIDRIIVGLYTLAILVFIFRRETSDVQDLPAVRDIIAVHYYQHIRNNKYTYSTIALVIFATLLYYIFAMYTNLRSGFVILVLWALLIACNEYISRQVNVHLQKDVIADFISEKLNLNNNEVQLIVSELQEKKITRINAIQEFLDKNTQYEASKSAAFAKHYVDYSDFLYSHERREVTSDEIEMINDTA